jgi:uncharacterized membrane protein
MTTVQTRRCGFGLGRFSLGILLAASVAAVAAPAAAQRFEAEEYAGPEGRVVRDRTASGGQAVIAGWGLAVQGSLRLPPGVYEVTFHVTAHPVELLHALAVTCRAGSTQRVMAAHGFDKSGVYVPVTLRLTHAGAELPVLVSGQGSSGFDGMRKATTEDEEKAFREAQAAFETGAIDKIRPADGGAPALAEEDLVNELEEMPDIRQMKPTDLFAGCDFIEVRKLAELPALASDLSVHKVHYLPGEEVRGSVTLRAVAGPGAYTLTVLEVRELAERRPVFTQDVELTAEPRAVAFSYVLGPEEFGRALVALLLPRGTPLPVAAADAFDPELAFPGCAWETFGVSRNVYRVGITGSGAGHDRSRLTAEGAAKIMQANKAAYANYFECFAWAPCDYSNLAPETEFFWSGQTQYPGSISGVRNLLSEAHKVGVKGITYGKACAGGIEGFKTFQRHPDYFQTSITGIGTEAMGTFMLEVMLANEYGGWQDWQSIWCNWENEATVDFGADAIIAAVRMFGWDGVRWDGHFLGKMARFKERMNAAVPGFVHGYNIAFANPGSELFLPSAPVDDFHECARDHGLMMDESVRDYSHTNFSYGRPEVFYQAICREADYMKRIGGLPLFITFDMASQLDRTYNVLMGLAGGQRYTYITSPAEFTYGNLTKWLTRFSAFVWDDTRRVKAPADWITVTAAPLADVEKTADGAERYPLLWQESCWLRDVAPGRRQLLVNLVNPPHYPAFANRVQPPARTRTDVRIEIKVPPGVTLAPLAHLSPDLPGGAEALAGGVDNGVCRVTLPRVGSWSIVAFDILPAAGDVLAGDPFPLTTPVEDAAAVLAQKEGEAQAKAQAEAARKAGIAAPAAEEERERRWTDYGLGRNFDAEDEVKPDTVKLLDETLRRPEQDRIVRDGILDVHHCRGIFSWLNPVQVAVGLSGAGRCTVSWLDRHYGRWQRGQPRLTLDEFPDSYPELFRHDVLVMDNIHAEDAGLLRRILIKDYVQAGGGLLVFGGHFNLSCGMDQSTWSEAILPLRVAGYRQFDIDEAQGFPLVPAEDGFFPADLDWSTAPAAFYVDRSPLADGARVLLRAGGHPAIVAGTFGKGRVIVVLMNPHGAPAAGAQPYWRWREWPRVLGACIRWLAEGCETRNDAGLQVRRKDPSAPDPETLRLEAEVQGADELAKSLRAARRNVVDQDSARYLLECTLDHIDRLKDIELLQDVLTTVAPHLDASFAPLFGKLQNQDLAPLRAAALRIIAYAQDTANLPYVRKQVGDEDPDVRHAAILALGGIGGEEAIALLRRQAAGAPDAPLKEGEYRFFAATRLAALQVPGALRDALQLYADQVRLIRSLKARHFSMHEDLYGGVSFKLTPEARRRLTNQFERFKRLEAVERRDAADFELLLQGLGPAQVEEAFEVFAATESPNLIPVAFSVYGRLPAAEQKRLAPRLRDARLPEIRVLAP